MSSLRSALARNAMEARALIAREATSAYARHSGRTISAGAFCADILACAEALPEADHVVNLCQDRYQFSVGFFAALIRGQINLLPTKRDSRTIATLRSQFSRVRTIIDTAYQTTAGTPSLTTSLHSNRVLKAPHPPPGRQMRPLPPLPSPQAVPGNPRRTKKPGDC